MIRIRTAEIRDLENTYKLFMDKTVRATAKNPKEVTFEEHKFWFLNRIKKENFFVIEDERGNFVGQIRIDERNGEKILSIELVELYRSKGYGTFALKYVLQNVVCDIIAYVHKKNIASTKLFEKLDFDKFEAEDNYWIYRKNSSLKCGDNCAIPKG